MTLDVEIAADGGARFTVELGITAYKRGDYRTAIRKFKALAEQGVAKAQFKLGVIYRNGQGVPKNYRKAAKPGYPR